MQIRSILLRGPGLDDALVTFEDRANILAGESDTGKSYLVHCLDYILGADEMKKRIEEAEPYSQLLVEFENSEAQFLTLERSLSGGDIAAYASRINDIKPGSGERIVPKRSGKSQAKDVTEILFAFADIKEATLRKNDRGDVNRLTIRTMLPLFLVDEISIIDERSPITGRLGFDATARKRAFAYMLSGKDDAGIIASERKDIAAARLNAQLSVISDILTPIEQRLQSRTQHADDSIERIDKTIQALSQSLADHSEERETLENERRDAIALVQHAESQLLAITELQRQYNLLAERYRSDLDRLDFITEGAHFFDGLQEVRCPLCDQLMSPEHSHKASERRIEVYEAARAEASKIRAHSNDLREAIKTLELLRSARETERNAGQDTIKRTDSRIRSILAPAMQDDNTRLDRLFSRRVELEAARSDEVQASDLRGLKEKIESEVSGRSPSSQKWEPLPAGALRKLCAEVEGVLKEWKWEGEGRVEFDETEYDIKVDGQRRQSHGKGVRAVLYSAFVIAVLRYCHTNGRPHPGTLVIDSPLTSYKKGKTGGKSDGPVSEGIESAFWQALRRTPTGVQIIIIENKEPPPEVAEAVHYEWFAGKNGPPGERKGFITAQS